MIKYKKTSDEEDMPKRAVVILAEGFEEVEAVTVIDILRRADIDVVVCGLGGTSIQGAHSVNLQADKELAEEDNDADAVILPGGMPGAENLAKSPVVRSLITKMRNDNKLIAAICASPAIVLAPIGILDNRKATVYPGMEKHFRKNTTFAQEDVVIDGNVITSRGPATALRFSLAIVEKLKGRDCSEDVKERTLV